MVRERWRRFAFLKRGLPQSRGWMADVLTCIRELGQDTFTLSDAYGFEGRLARLHPHNRNVRPKIRQQLQVLRDHGIIRFLGGGRYCIT
jgi:type II restriction enzyme